MHLACMCDSPKLRSGLVLSLLSSICLPMCGHRRSIKQLRGISKRLRGLATVLRVPTSQLRTVWAPLGDQSMRLHGFLFAGSDTWAPPPNQNWLFLWECAARNCDAAVSPCWWCCVQVSVLDKSKMDWQDFKKTDKEVQEELEAHARSDKQYLERQVRAYMSQTVGRCCAGCVLRAELRGLLRCCMVYGLGPHGHPAAATLEGCCRGSVCTA